MAKNRILIATTVPYTLEVFLLPHIASLRQAGWHVDIAASGVSDSAISRASADNAFEVRMARSLGSPLNVFAVGDIRRIIASNSYDIVHVHTPIAGFATRMAAATLSPSKRPKIVYTAHGFHFHSQGKTSSNAVFAGAERIGGRYTDALIVINDEDFRSAQSLHLVPPDALHQFAGIGLDLVQWNPTRVSDTEVEDVRHELQLLPQDRSVLMVAELNPGKRHRDLLDAMATPRLSTVHVLIAGEGPEFGRLKDHASALGIDNRVHFLGFRDDIPALMLGCQATVLPSEREGLPRSVMESMALGIPVVGTRVRGIEDLLHGERGILVPVGQPEALSVAIESVLRGGPSVTRMARLAAEYVQRFAFDRVFEQHLALYSELVGR